MTHATCLIHANLPHTVHQHAHSHSFFQWQIPLLKTDFMNSSTLFSWFLPFFPARNDSSCIHIIWWRDCEWKVKSWCHCMTLQLRNVSGVWIVQIRSILHFQYIFMLKQNSWTRGWCSSIPGVQGLTSLQAHLGKLNNIGNINQINFHKDEKILNTLIPPLYLDLVWYVLQIVRLL